MTKIYESPDKGKTIYEREFHSKEKKLIKSDGELDLEDHILWNEIRQAAKTNITLQKAIARVKMLYRLSVDDPK
jgi:hypothetical protein